MKFLFYPLFFFSLCTINLCAVDTYHFDILKDGKTAHSIWKVIREVDNTLRIEGKEKGKVTEMETSSTYRPTKVNVKSVETNTFYDLEMKGGMLYSKGHVDGKIISREYKQIYPWIQQLWCGLIPFGKSTDKKFKFCIFNPKNLQIYNMVATKDQIDDVKIGTKTRKGQRMKITLQGFQSIFWKAYAWYDTETGDFLMYRGNDGPNTPVTVIYLSSKE